MKYRGWARVRERKIFNGIIFCERNIEYISSLLVGTDEVFMFIKDWREHFIREGSGSRSE
jgi:hypothetical protein